MEHEKILKAIENADPSNNDQLDKIDKMVSDYLGKIPKPIAKYTRSRDALKGIRINKYQFSIFTTWDNKSLASFDNEDEEEYICFGIVRFKA